MTRLFIVGWMAFFVAVANGQQDSIVRGTLDSVVVTSSRINTALRTTPMSVAVLRVTDRQPFLALNSLQEQINEVPGIVTFNSANYAQDLRISIRGFGARSAFGIRGLKLIVDGIPETTPDGQGQLDNLSLQDISDIEIIRGASSSLYGNAAGGVINMNTTDPTNADLLRASMRIGSFNTRQYQLSGGFKAADVSGLISLSHQQSDGYREHSAYQQSNLLAKLKFSLSDNSTLKLNVSYLSSPQGQDPGGITLADAEADPTSARDRNVQLNAGEEINHWKVGVAFNSTLNDQFEFSAYGFLSGRSFDGRIPLLPGGVIDLDRIYGGHGSQLQYKTIASKSSNTISIGYDIAAQSDTRLRYDNIEGNNGDKALDQVEQFDNIGIFLLDHYAVGDWRLNGGIRYDYNLLSIDDSFLNDGDDSGSITLSNLNPSVGVSRLISDDKTLFVNYSTSFETPTLSELSANPSGTGGFNQELNPQLARSIEIGWRHGVNKAFDYELALYNIATSDESIPYELADFPGRIFYRNAGDTKRSGVEMSSNWSPVLNLKLSGSYSYSRILYDDYTLDGDDLSDNRIPGLPLHTMSLSGNYSTDDIYLRLQYNHLGSLYADDNNEVLVISANVTTLQIGGYINIGKIQIIPSLAVNNLFDAAYFDNIRVNAFGSRYYEPAPTRFIQFGMSFRYR